jgi:ADP-ribose pyrophosphatase YjhB (NUDIX family)
LQAIAQTGLTYAVHPFEIERYEAIRDVAAEIMATGGRVAEVSVIVDLLSRDLGYATPKVDVRVAAFDRERVLLVREREDECWTLPGGWADVGTAPSVNAVREVKEESGFDSEILKLAAVYDRNLRGHPPIPFHAYKLFFIARLTGGSEAHSVETNGVGFFAEDNLPKLSMTRVTPEEIRHMFDHYRHPEWPSSFD